MILCLKRQDDLQYTIRVIYCRFLPRVVFKKSAKSHTSVWYIKREDCPLIYDVDTSELIKKKCK